MTTISNRALWLGLLALGLLAIGLSISLGGKGTIPFGGAGGNIVATNAPSEGEVLHSDGTNYYWTTPTASSTNVPNYVLTNSDTRVYVRFVGGISNQGPTVLEAAVTNNSSMTNVGAFSVGGVSTLDGFTFLNSGASNLGTLDVSGQADFQDTLVSHNGAQFIGGNVYVDGQLGANQIFSTNNITSLTSTNTDYATNGGNMDIGGLLNIWGGLHVEGALSETSTNVINGLTENGSPASGVMLLALDPAVPALRKVDVANLPGGTGGGTNFPPVLNLLGGTNITVGSGVRQAWTLTTNASFKLVFTGTPLNGETVEFAVSNFSATANIYVTNTVYDPLVSSNVTELLVISNSVRFLTFRSQTNFNNGTARWELVNDRGLLPELAFVGLDRTVTNNNVITQYRAYSYDFISAGFFQTNSVAANGTNFQATVVYDNSSTNPAPTPYAIFDPSATNVAFFVVTTPEDWDGGPIKFKYHYGSSDSSASTNVLEISAGVMTGAGWDTITYGAAVTKTNANTSAGDVFISAATSAVTIGGSTQPGYLIGFKLRRLPGHADDTDSDFVRVWGTGIQWGLTNAVVTAW